VPVLAWRAVAHTHTAHAIETILDELARRTGKDPVAFRRHLLADQARDLAVLELVAQKAGWGRPMAMDYGQDPAAAFHTDGHANLLSL
jgi:isoquinoline 1-oxidoreductase subunit beta